MLFVPHAPGMPRSRSLRDLSIYFADFLSSLWVK